MKTVTINGNIVTITGLSELEILTEILERGLSKRQFSGIGARNGTVSLSFPMTKSDHSEFAAAIHRYNSELINDDPVPPVPPTVA